MRPQRSHLRSLRNIWPEKSKRDNQSKKNSRIKDDLKYHIQKYK